MLGAQGGAPEMYMRRERSRQRVSLRQQSNGGRATAPTGCVHVQAEGTRRRRATWRLGSVSPNVETIDRQSSVAAKPPAPVTTSAGAIESGHPRSITHRHQLTIDRGGRPKKI